MSAGEVRIHYQRPPDREQLFVQRFVHETPEVVVTLMEHTPLPRPMRIGGQTALEDGAPVVWFTFPGERHDIGRFHRADGSFTGLYANILTPVHFRTPRVWETTDLFLDVWLGPDGAPRILDGEELEEAVARGWLDEQTARTARTEANRIARAARAGAWPPPPVHEWTLERARRALA